MSTGNFFKDFNFHSDFVAVTYNQWQKDQVKRKPYNMVARLKMRSGIKYRKVR